MRISIDIETYSSNDITKCGVYKYVEAQDFEILMIAFAIDDSQVVLIDLSDKDPRVAKALAEFIELIKNPNAIKSAWNANFERVCLSKYFNITLPTEQWECTMVRSAMCGLPLSLDVAAKVTGVPVQKMAEGKALIKYFSVPCKPTKVNGQRIRNLAQHAPDKWETFKNYCAMDVMVERAIYERLKFYKITDFERELYVLDQEINDRGVAIDIDFVKAAIEMDNKHKENLMQRAFELTKLSNPNSINQLKEWLETATGEEISGLTKKDIPQLLKDHQDDKGVQEVLQIRQGLSKTSVKKYQAMLNGVCEDGRVRGLLQFYGANRTGRWAGRLVQVQNLPKNDESLFGEDMKLLDFAREAVKSEDLELVSLFFDVPTVLSQLIRPAFIAPKGYKLIPSDFAAIEARVIAWLAGELWRIDVFNTHGKIYEASAAQMFKVDIGTIKKDGPNYALRQRGKVAELALGYQGGVGALIQMGALDMGIPEEDLKPIVNAWREANPFIVQYWNQLDKAAKQAIKNPGSKFTTNKGIVFFMHNGILFVKLPSGRYLSYFRARLAEGQYGDVIKYEGMDQTTKKWTLIDTYGGKLVENVVQAVARDCLAEALVRLRRKGYDVVMHVHDEAVLQVPDEQINLDEINAIMGETIPWAQGLPLKAESYITEYYKKD